MWRSLLFCAVMGAVLLAAATTRSDVAQPQDDATSDAVEPADDGAILAGPSEHPAHKDPFAPYDVGPPEGILPYEALTPEERQVVDRGRDASGWRPVHDGFAAGVRERSVKARAEAAQHTLGVDGLEDTGVVP